MSSSDNSPPKPTPSKKAKKNDFPDLASLSDEVLDIEQVDAAGPSFGASNEPVVELTVDEKTAEKQSLIRSDPVCGTGRKDDPVTEQPRIAGASIHKRRPKRMSRAQQRLQESEHVELSVSLSDKILDIEHRLLGGLSEPVGDLTVDEKTDERLSLIQSAPGCSKVKKDDAATEEPHIVGASHRRRRPKRKSHAKQRLQDSEHAKHAVSKNIRDKSTTEKHKLDVLDDFDIDIDSDVRQRMDLYIDEYIANLNHRISLDGQLNTIFETFNRIKVLDELLGSLLIFDEQVQNIGHEYKEDVACASSSQETIESEETAGDREIEGIVKLKDSNTICETYNDKVVRVNIIAIHRADLFKGLCDSLDSYDTSTENKAVTKLIMKTNSYRGICLMRAITVKTTITTLASIVHLRHQESIRIRDNRKEMAKSTSLDAKSKEDAINSYKRAVTVVMEIEKIQKQLEAEYKYMREKNGDLFSQSDSTAMWEPHLQVDYPSRHPSFMMTKLNWLLQRSFEVFNSLRKIISRVQCIITLANLLAS